jgi:hypothetical protein
MIKHELRADKVSLNLSTSLDEVVYFDVVVAG